MTAPTPPPPPGGNAFLNSLDPTSPGFGLPGLLNAEGGAGGAIAGAAGSLFGPITEMFAASKAGLYNTLNQIFNSVFYGVIAGAGFLVMVYGIYTLAKEVPGAGGITNAIGGLAGLGGKIAGLAAL